MVRLRSPAPILATLLYGRFPERPKGADCKSVVNDFAGPNPASPTTNDPMRKHWVFCLWWGMHVLSAFRCFAPESGSFIFARQKSARKRMLAKMPRQRRESSLALLAQISLGNVGVLFCGLWDHCSPFKFIENSVYIFFHI